MTANRCLRAAIVLGILTLPGCIGYSDQPGHEKGQGGVSGSNSGDTGPAGVGATNGSSTSGRPAGVDR